MIGKERVFDTTAILDALPADLRPGGHAPGTFGVNDAWLRGPTEVVLELGDGGGDFLSVHVHLREPRAPRFRRTAHLDICHHPRRGDGRVDRGSATADALQRLGEAIDRLDEAHLRWLSPAPQVPLRAENSREKRRRPPDYLTVDAACGLHCRFCTLATAGGDDLPNDDPTFAALQAQVDAQVSRGARSLYVDGRDPVAYPRLAALLDHARQRGIADVHLLTPGTRLADPAVLEAILRALPSRHWLHIPVYGATAAVHDTVTGAPGSYAAVQRALALLAERKPPPQVVVVTVVTRQNLHEIARIRDAVARLGMAWRPHLVYPMAGGSRQQYRDVAVRLSEVQAALVTAMPPMLLAEVPPCVALRSPRPARRSFGQRATSTLPGATARDGAAPASAGNAAVLPCPARGSCAAASVCSGMVYADYVGLFTWTEFQPLRACDLDGPTRLVVATRRVARWFKRA